MNKKLQRYLIRHWRWYRHSRLFVIIDPKDNSVTFSKALFRYLDIMDEPDAKVHVFRLCNATSECGDRSVNIYAFCINPPIEQETQLADIQYNSKYHCVGFESLCPTVARICYDYGLPMMKPVKLSVELGSVQKAAAPLDYFILMPPKR